MANHTKFKYSPILKCSGCRWLGIWVVAFVITGCEEGAENALTLPEELPERPVALEKTDKDPREERKAFGEESDLENDEFAGVEELGIESEGELARKIDEDSEALTSQLETIGTEESDGLGLTHFRKMLKKATSRLKDSGETDSLLRVSKSLEKIREWLLDDTIDKPMLIDAIGTLANVLEAIAGAKDYRKVAKEVEEDLTEFEEVSSAKELEDLKEKTDTRIEEWTESGSIETVVTDEPDPGVQRSEEQPGQQANETESRQPEPTEEVTESEPKEQETKEVAENNPIQPEAQPEEIAEPVEEVLPDPDPGVLVESADDGIRTSPYLVDFQTRDRVFYTLDGSEPTTDSELFAAPFFIGLEDGSVTLKAVRIMEDGRKSATLQEDFEFDLPDLAAPQFSLSSGIYGPGTELSITHEDSEATIYYTVDGSTPSTDSFDVTGSVALVSGSQTIKVFAVRWGYTDSLLQTLTLDMDDNPPNAASDLAESSVLSTIASLQWSETTDNYTAAADLEYRVVVSESSSDVSTLSAFQSQSGSKVLNWSKGATHFDLTGLNPATEYHAAIAVRDEVGQISLATPISFLTAPGTPQNLTLTTDTDSMTVSFDPVAGATGYTLYYDTQPNVTGASSSVDLGTDTSYTISGLSSGDNYYFKATARNGTGSGHLSSERSAQTDFPSFVFDSLGDENGIIYHLGTQYGTEAFSNPVGRSLVDVTMNTSPSAGTEAATVDRGPNQNNSMYYSNAWWVRYDFKKTAYMRVQSYSIKQNSSTRTMRGWNLQGSHDGVLWKNVDVRTDIGYLSNENRHWIVNQPTDFYRYWRVYRTQTMNGGYNYFGFAEIEFYGEVDDSNKSKPPTTVTTMNQDSLTKVFIEDVDPEVDAYAVYYDTATPQLGTATRVEGPANSLVIDVPGLTNGTEYTFRIASIKDGVEGPLSLQSYQNTPSTSYDFDFLGDGNGVLHFLGTNQGTASYSNPETDAQIDITSNAATSSGSHELMVDRSLSAQNVSMYYSNAYWYTYDFKSTNLLKVTGYSIRQNNSTRTMRGWNLQGSHDNINWTNVDIRTDVAHNQNGSAYFAVNQDTDFYQYWRLYRTQTMNGGYNYYGFAEIEFYGELDLAERSRPPAKATTMNQDQMIKVFIDDFDANVDRYVVYYDTVTPEVGTATRLEGPLGSAVIDIPGLTNGTEYTIRIAAIKDGIEGPLTIQSYSNTPSATFDFDFLGDGNGIFYYLGTNSGTAPHSNPEIDDLVDITSNAATSSGSYDLMVDRALGGQYVAMYYSNAYWYTYDFKQNSRLKVTGYSVRQNNSTRTMRGWNLQGSHDNINWTNVDIRMDVPHNQNGSSYFAVNQSTDFYRYWRVYRTQTMNGSYNYWGWAEIEFYGELSSENPIAPPSYATSMNRDGKLTVVIDDFDVSADRYVVYLDTTTPVPGVATRVVGDAGASVIEIDGLVNGTEYQIRISAIKDGNEGPLTVQSYSNTPSATKDFDYYGDGNGIFYYVGTSGGTSAYSNPISSGEIGGAFQSLSTGSLDGTVNRSTSAENNYSNYTTGNLWLYYDFKKTGFAKVTEYTIRSNNHSSRLQGWNLQGSHDGVNWVNVDVRSGQSVTRDSWRHYTINQATDFYRYWRVYRTENMSSSNYFGVAEIEFYGEIDQSDKASPPAYATTMNLDEQVNVMIDDFDSDYDRYVVYYDTVEPQLGSATRLEGPLGSAVIPVAGLTNGTLYHFRVSGIKDGIEGPLTAQQYTNTPSTSMQFDFYGDGNGVLYNLGTNGGTETWQNPHTAGRMVATMESVSTGSPEDMVDRSGGNQAVYTLYHMSNTWLNYDFLSTGLLRVQTYMIRTSSHSSRIKGWDLRASHDGINWVTVDSRSGLSLSSNTSYNYTVNGTTDYYRYWRIVRTENMSSSNYFGVNDIEFYGEMDTSNPSRPPAALTTMNMDGQINVVIDDFDETVDRYVVYYDTVTPEKATATRVSGDAGAAVIVLPGLINGTTYQIRVAAETGGIEGPLTSVTYSNTPSESLVYDFSLDGNGLFYYLGTNGGTEAFQNPVDRGTLGVSMSSVSTGDPKDMVDHSAANQAVYTLYHMDNTDLIFDLQVASFFRVQSYAIKASTHSSRLRGFKLQGSHDGTTWNDVDSRTGLSVPSNSWQHYTVNGTTDFYRYWRFYRSENMTSSNYFGLAEIEFYGDFN